MKKYFKITKVLCLLMLAGTFTVATAQCDLKLTEKVTKLLKDDGLTYLKDFILEFEEVNSTKAYSFLLQKGAHYFLYFGVAGNEDSEIEFMLTTYKTEAKQLTVRGSGKISKIEIKPEETDIYHLLAQSMKGKKPCGVVVLGLAPPPPLNNSDYNTTTDDKIYLMVDEMPEFILGEKEAFQSWVKNNIKYPEVASKKGIIGKVFISFVINKFGDVTNINVLRGLNPEVDAVVVKELKKCPRWQKPAKDKGKPVNLQFTFSIDVKPM